MNSHKRAWIRAIVVSAGLKEGIATAIEACGHKIRNTQSAFLVVSQFLQAKI
jgi:hypothetical protein